MPKIKNQMSTCKLFIRLSSLGDVILSTAALEALAAGEQADWIVGKEYASLLRNHPKIRKLWEFDRKQGIWSWLKFLRTLCQQNYTHVYDLHLNLRSRLARLVFLVFARDVQWKSISKERIRFLGLFVFKRYWPSRCKPTLQIEKFFRISQDRQKPIDHAKVKTNLRHLLKDAASPQRSPLPDRYYCVMPSANWIAKRWKPASYCKLIQELDAPAVIMGVASDEESVELVRLLEENKVEHYSGIGSWNLIESARILAGSLAYIGNDTGLAHLSEAMGKKAFILFGPSSYGMGFGPYLKESQAIESPLWCRPCGKDGRACFRVIHRFKCLDTLKPEFAIKRIQDAQKNKN